MTLTARSIVTSALFGLTALRVTFQVQRNDWCEDDPSWSNLPYATAKTLPVQFHAKSVHCNWLLIAACERE
jgi:hypothetical protein